MEGAAVIAWLELSLACAENSGFPPNETLKFLAFSGFSAETSFPPETAVVRPRRSESRLTSAVVLVLKDH
jgi:hypothetical protein